jgi:hypothetical protein
VIAPRAREASVQISLQFDRSRTVDSAAQDVQAAINEPVAPPAQWKRRKRVPEIVLRPRPVERQRVGQARYFAALIERVRFAIDSLLEGEGFEPSVPRSPVSSVGVARRSLLAREQERFTAISSAQLAIPWSRSPMWFWWVAVPRAGA